MRKEKRKYWFAAGAIATIVVAAFFVVVGQGSRVVVIAKSGNNSSTATVTPNGAVANDPTGTDPTATTLPYYPGTAQPMTDAEKTAYDAKALAIANLTTISIKHVVNSSTIYYTTSTRPIGWPVRNAAYPNEGALLPAHRIVAYYGNFYSTQMGVLGQYPEQQVLSMLASTSAMWAAADPSTPVIQALDYIVVTAQGSAGSDGKYRLRMPDDQIEKAITMANQINGVVFLDIQVGLSNVETEVPLLEKYLALPNVELSLDPEFDMHNGERPGTVIGTMDASDINFAAQYIANLVREYNLPPKILVVHRFTDDMVTNTSAIKPLPEVQVVMDMDGFGFPAKKINTYEQVIVPYPVQFTGFKLFYHNDTLGPLGHLMTPEEVLKLSPQPSYIQYQ
jgi:hypothetical protein